MDHDGPVTQQRTHSDPDQAEPTAQQPDPDAGERSARALARYRARTRRTRAVYFTVVTVVVAAISLVAGLVWANGEIAHTTLRTADHPPADLAPSAPAGTQSLAWSSADATAAGTPYWHGTVVTYSTHSVRGHDARTGEITWSYTRTQRSVCEAIQVRGVTLAIFERNGNCDQVTGLDSATGERQWTRTLDKDGHPVNGHPGYSIGPYTVLVTTPSVIYAIDPASGLDRWLFTHPGCRINSAVLGSRGALISQNCTQPECSEKKFCGKGPQLLLRDATAGRDDDADAKNPDQIKWNLIGNREIPLAADQFTAAIEPDTHRLRVRSPDEGTLLRTLRLHRAPEHVRDARTISTAQAEIIWLDGVSYAISSDGTRILWTRPTPAAPTVLDPAAQSGQSNLYRARITVGTRAGIATIDGADGTITKTYPVGSHVAGSRVYPLGSGFLAAGDHTRVFR